MTSFLAFIFVLGVLIFVHELGHFLMARRIGVRVLTFSLGFGPKLLSFRRGNTEYCVSAIPLGGYVKMAGENPEDARTGAPDEFLSKGKWQRFQVLVMGPVMNVLLAIVVMAVVLYQGAPVPLFESQPVVVGSVLPNTPAVSAGIRPGDRILMVDDEPVDTWEHFSIAIVPKAKRRVHLLIDRGGNVAGKYRKPRPFVRNHRAVLCGRTQAGSSQPASLSAGLSPAGPGIWRLKPKRPAFWQLPFASSLLIQRALPPLYILQEAAVSWASGNPPAPVLPFRRGRHRVARGVQEALRMASVSGSNL